MSKIRVTEQRLKSRTARRRRVRARISGTASKPRIAIYRSNAGMYIQAIDDEAGKTLAAVNDRGLAGKTKTERAHAAGKQIGEMLKKSGVTQAVFDRAGFLYHGRVAAAAEGVRAAGVKL